MHPLLAATCGALLQSWVLSVGGALQRNEAQPQRLQCLSSLHLSSAARLFGPSSHNLLDIYLIAFLDIHLQRCLLQGQHSKQSPAIDTAAHCTFHGASASAPPSSVPGMALLKIDISCCL